MESSKSILVGQKHEWDYIPIPELFERIAYSKSKDKLAVISEDGKFTFSQLNILANRWAHILLRLLQQPPSVWKTSLKPPIIAIFVQENFMRIVTLLAIFKLKAAYVPLDAVLPHERMYKIIRETDASLVICQTEEDKNSLNTTCHTFSGVINIKDFVEEMEASSYDSNIRPEALFYTVEDDPLLCILYTSGSTGEPKGVPLHMHNLINRLSWQWEVFPFCADDIGCHKTSMLFVDSLTEIFGCLLKGIPLVLIPKNTTQNPEALLQMLHKYKVTKIVVVPSLLSNMLAEAKRNRQSSLGCLKIVVCSGEALSPELANDFLKTCKSVLLANYYGSTETTGDVTFEIFRAPSDIVTKQKDGFLSIGIPVTNSNIYVLDDHLETVADGQKGTIYISGLNITNCYLEGKEPDNFAKNPFSNEMKHHILYKTGDIGVIIDGRLYFQGRKDSQVKIRGHRVNLREVELALATVKAIDHVTVLACNGSKSTTNIVAFYKLFQKEHGQLDRDNILCICKAKLPGYMLPILLEIEHIPLQPQTGKIDRVQLQKMYKEMCLGVKLTKEEFTQLSIANVVQHLISYETGVPLSLIGKSDSFFDIGGNSISALSIVLSLQDLGYNVTITDFLQSRYVADIIHLVQVTKHQTHTSQHQSISGTCKVPNAIKQRYDVKMLNQCADKEKAIALIAEGFSQKNPLDVIMGTSKESIVRLIRSFWIEICLDDLSIVVCDIITDKIVAATIILDIQTEINPVFDIPAVAEINDAVEKPVKDKLLEEGGRWVDSILNAVDVEIADDEGLIILQMMEEEVIQLAEKRGYDGIITVNSHPVTMVSKIRSTLLQLLLQLTLLGHLTQFPWSVKVFQLSLRFLKQKVFF